MQRVLVLSLVVLCLAHHCGGCVPIGKQPEQAPGYHFVVTVPQDGDVVAKKQGEAGGSWGKKQGEMPPPSGEGADASADSDKAAATER